MTTTNMTKFGHFIRQRRRKLGISQKKLAKAIGVKDSYLSRLEDGNYFQTLRFEVAIPLGANLDIPLSELCSLLGVDDKKRL